MWLNPIGQDGNPIRCRCCESIRHVVKDCPDSYQNQEKGINFVKITFFTGNQDKEMQVFFNACLYSADLDSGWSANVAWEDWLKNYLDSQSQEELAKLKRKNVTPYLTLVVGGVLF